MNPTDALDKLKHNYSSLLENIGENPKREGLLKTPERAAKALQYLTQGYDQDIEAIINNALFDSDISEMVIVKDIELYSLCEHHLLPFFGQCHVAYIPNGKVLGLSKIARIVDVFARRLQIQENLNQDIANTIMHYTQAKGVGVVIEAQHLCMKMRGVNKQSATMTTSTLLGAFKENALTRNEFLQLLK